MRDGQIVADRRVEAPRSAAGDLLDWKKRHVLLASAKGENP